MIKVHYVTSVILPRSWKSIGEMMSESIGRS